LKEAQIILWLMPLMFQWSPLKLCFSLALKTTFLCSHSSLGRKVERHTPIVDDEVRRSSRLKRGTSFQHIFIDGGSSNRPKVKVLGSSSLLQEEENKGQG